MSTVHYSNFPDIWTGIILFTMLLVAFCLIFDLTPRVRRKRYGVKAVWQRVVDRWRAYRYAKTPVGVALRVVLQARAKAENCSELVYIRDFETSEYYSTCHTTGGTIWVADRSQAEMVSLAEATRWLNVYQGSRQLNIEFIPKESDKSCSCRHEHKSRAGSKDSA